MTTTMDSHTSLQYSVQSPPQEQPQIKPPPDDPPPALPIIPEDTATQCLPPPSDINNIDARAQKKQRMKELRDLSKTFGHIPNVPIFSSWETRIDCSNSAVHRAIMAGICGNRRHGAYSIALSSLYKDDEDGGDVILYTGSGGRKRWTDSFPPKRLRLGPQTMDQSWDDPPNKALAVSFLSGNPVRVIRSWRCPSQYAPVSGYRYDGLYRVAAYWTAKGLNKKDICRCRLERLPDQPPIPLRPIIFSTSSRRNRQRLVSRPTCTPSPSTDPRDIPNGTNFDTGSNQTKPSPTQLVGSTGRESEKPSTPPQQPVSHQREIPPKPDALPRYRWNPKKHELVRVPAPHPIPEDLDAMEGVDDVTLVPSEDGRADTPANERMETEYFSDGGNSPRPGTPNEPSASGSSVPGNQGYC